MHQKALEIRIKVVGHDHTEVAASYSNIGSVYDSQGKYEEALEMYQKALEIDTKVPCMIHALARFAEFLIPGDEIIDKQHVGPGILIALSNEGCPTRPKWAFAPGHS